MDWIAIVDVAILIVATAALLGSSPGLPFGAARPSAGTDVASTMALAER